MSEDQTRAVIARIARERFLVSRDGEWADRLLAALRDAGLVQLHRNTVQLCRDETANLIDDIGGCDHGANICVCGLRSLLADLDDALAAAKEPTDV